MARITTGARYVAAGVGLAAVGYATWAGLAWCRYGKPSKAEGDTADPLLDRFMPDFDVVERHHIGIDAPADVVLAAAKEQDLNGSSVIRAIFKARALVMGATGAEMPGRGLLSQVQAMGWGVLADTPGEIVLGAVTRPWEADVVFKALSPETFAAFNEPGYVKIVWSLRADPLALDQSTFRTETRARATDPSARTKFRRYWALTSAGIALIRLLSLQPLKVDAERRWHEATRAGEPMMVG